MKTQTERAAMNPSTPKTELQPSTQLRKVAFGGSQKQFSLNRAASKSKFLSVLLLLTLCYTPAHAQNAQDIINQMRELQNRPQRPTDTGRDVYYDDVVTRYKDARKAVVSTQRSLRDVEILGQSLTGEARAMFEKIPPDRRTSYDQAMASVLESYTQIRAKNQELVERLARVSEELRALQSQIFQVEGRRLRLRSEITDLEKTAEELRAEEQRIAAELTAVSACEEFARNLSLALDRELAASRNEYWTEIGRYFKDRDLGTPVDYASPLQPLPAQTERRVEVRDERRMMTPVAVVASSPPGAAAVIANWGYAFPAAAVAARASNPATTGSGNEAELGSRLAKWDQAQQEYRRRSVEASTALIESEQARRELKEYIAREQAAERDHNFATDAVERLRTEVSWKVWELEQRTSGARDWLSQCVDKVVEKGRWQALKSILKKSLASPVAARSMYAHLHLAGKINDDLSRAPDIILHSDDPGMQPEVQRLMSNDKKYGKDFISEAAGAKSPLRQIVEKLLGPELKKD